MTQSHRARINLADPDATRASFHVPADGDDSGLVIELRPARSILGTRIEVTIDMGSGTSTVNGKRTTRQYTVTASMSVHELAVLVGRVWAAVPEQELAPILQVVRDKSGAPL